MEHAVETVRDVTTALAVVVACAVALVLVVGLTFGGLGVVVGTAADVFASPSNGSTAGGPAGAAPDATFTANATGDGVLVEHAGGDGVVARDLVVDAGGDARQPWTELDENATVVHDGDAVTVTGADDADEIAVYWVGGGDPVELHVGTV